MCKGEQKEDCALWILWNRLKGQLNAAVKRATVMMGPEASCLIWRACNYIERKKSSPTTATTPTAGKEHTT